MHLRKDERSRVLNVQWKERNQVMRSFALKWFLWLWRLLRWNTWWWGKAGWWEEARRWSSNQVPATRSLLIATLTKQKHDSLGSPGRSFLCGNVLSAREKRRLGWEGWERLERRETGCCARPPARPSSPPTPAPTPPWRRPACWPAKLSPSSEAFLGEERGWTTLSSSFPPLQSHQSLSHTAPPGENGKM